MDNKQNNRCLKKGFSLIELIISIVILSLILITIPKTFEVINKNNDFTKREDGIFNNYTVLDNIKLLNWDENNVNNNDILITANGISKFNCNINRTYGFINSRKCLLNLPSSLLEAESNELLPENYDDIDDFNNFSKDIMWKGIKLYTTKVKVSYISDDIIEYDYVNKKVNINLKNKIVSDNTNIKNIKVYTVGNKSNEEYLVSLLEYYSTNIGKIKLEFR